MGLGAYANGLATGSFSSTCLFSRFNMSSIWLNVKSLKKETANCTFSMKYFEEEVRDDTTPWDTISLSFRIFSLYF